MAALSEAAVAAAGWCGAAARFTRFRGDGWQCLAPDPPLALRTALFLRAALRRQGRDLDTRISVGFGSGDLPEADLAAASGPVFRAAGHGLDRMVRQVRLSPSWESPPLDAAQVAAIFVLCDAVSRRWTSAQAAILRHALAPQPPVQAAIAAQEGISQQMVAKHLQTAGDWAVQQAMAAFEGREPAAPASGQPS